MFVILFRWERLAFWVCVCVVLAFDSDSCLFFCLVVWVERAFVPPEVFPLPLWDEVAMLLETLVDELPAVVNDVAAEVAVPSCSCEMVWKMVCIVAIGAGITSAVVNTAAEMPSATRRFSVLRSVMLESSSLELPYL